MDDESIRRPLGSVRVPRRPGASGGAPPAPLTPQPVDALAEPADAVIDTREELILALTEASELEHGLLVQYLFAAYSLKRRPSEGPTEAQLERMRAWERAILSVAREEMAHLGTVCNMLTAVGGTPRLGRPNFPQGREGSFPRLRDSAYPFDFQLERFGESSLDRFVAAEMPADQRTSDVAAELVPDPLRFDRLGELYGQIADAFRRIDASLRERGERLFIGPPQAQDRSGWTASLRLMPVTDVRSAVAAVEFIVLEGEGAPSSREGSHYQRFLDIRAALRAERAASPTFEPARPVAVTPVTRRHRDAGDGPFTPIPEGTRAYAVAGLFNSVYATTLLMLLQFYDFAGETAEQRAGLQAGIRQSMSAIIRPLAEILTALPLEDGTGLHAGPGFELYGQPQVPSHMESRWTLLGERLGQAAAECRRLAEPGSEPLGRLAFVADNLALLNGNVGRLAGGR